jgi:Na+/H+ antiporter NhaD/arsenite permease-like protein
MTAVILSLLLIGYLLIATEHVTKINKAVVAMFIGVTGWILYMMDGTRYVMTLHAGEYLSFLSGHPTSTEMVKVFIGQNIFMNYVANISQVVLFLLATMYIVEVLDNNQCFDFFSEWLRTRRSKRLLWSLAGVTFVLSANVNNITAACMMIAVMHRLVENHRQRMAYASIIVLAANTGGCFTVIGDVSSLLLWAKGAITATNFSAHLILPAMVATVIPTYLVSRTLPEHLDFSYTGPRYRGSDTRLNNWQRIFMLIVGIGGLWFIPSFCNITKLPPFLGALCVLAILWVVNEIYNRKLINSDVVVRNTNPSFMQFNTMQLILFVVGISLAVGAIQETGVLAAAARWLDDSIHNVYLVSVFVGLISAFLDNFVLVLSTMSMYPVREWTEWTDCIDSNYLAGFVQNGIYWQLLSFCGGVGGSLLTIGSMSGYALMKIEGVNFTWYLKRMTWKVLLGWIVGLGVFFVLQIV